MAESQVNLYEGLFLISQQAVASDFAGCVDHLKEIFDRAEAEVLTLRKWDERKLAYPIAGQRRGTYMLAYFNVRGTQIANIERDCSLSETILRALIVRAEHMGETELELEKQEVDARSEARMREAGEAEVGGDAPATEAPAATDAAAPEAEAKPAEPAVAGDENKEG